MHAAILLLPCLFVLSLADIAAVHEKPVAMKVKKGGDLSIKIPTATSIWHRKFKDGRPEQTVETCPGPDNCGKWKSGFVLTPTVSNQKVSIGKDGTLTVPKVSSTDSAQYFTYFLGNDGQYHYVYYDVVVA